MEPGKSDGEPDMNAAASRVETKVIAEDRIARIESDVAEIKDDVKTINIRLNDSIVANAREFGALRADTEKRFGTLQVAIESNKTVSEKGFGGLRVEIEKIRTTIESTKFWLIMNTVGIVATILGAITAYLHAVKII
jgi:hypothetical protein